MPIHIRHEDTGVDVTIRPTPLVNISSQINKTSAGRSFGMTYNITLTGTLLADQGSPYGRRTIGGGGLFPFYGTTPNLNGPYGQFDTSVSHVEGGRPPKQQVPLSEAATSIITKQRALRALFAEDGQRTEITDYQEDRTAIVCYPRVVDISFSEGVWVDRCDFTITLEADTLLFGEGGNEPLDSESTVTGYSEVIPGTVLEEDILNDATSINAFISEYDDSWDVSIDLNVGEDDTQITYTINHKVSATGKQHFGPNGESAAWQEARRFVRGKMAVNGIYDYPNIEFPQNWVIGDPVKFSPGIIDLFAVLTGYDYTVNEEINEPAGTYAATESWKVTPTTKKEGEEGEEGDDDGTGSGRADDNFSTTTKISTGSPWVTVSINGTITGKSTDTRNGIKLNSPLLADAEDNPELKSKIDNAMEKWHEISNNGQFGLNCAIYERLNALVAVELNSQPLSVTVGQNVFSGEVTYQLDFDNRPTNFVTGTLSESISINDTLPGDVFAAIPVLGRRTGPVLQYIGGRTEYRRDLSINLTMDYRRIPYANNRDPLLLLKPSIIEPTASEIQEIINSASPANEPLIRKYFVGPPSESWDAKTGNYSFNISWTYELET